MTSSKPPLWFAALFLLFYLPASPLRAQITVVAKPTLKYAKKQVWFVSLTNEGAAPVTVSREAVMQKFLAIHEYPNDIAQDVLSAAASGSPRSWVPTLFGVLLPLGQTAAEGTALATHKNGPVYIAGAVSIISVVVQLVSSRAKNPAKYFPEALPMGAVTLPSGGGATYGVVSDLMPGAVALGPFEIGEKKGSAQ